MATDKQKSGMDTRTKATIGIMVVVVLIIVWQVIGLFSGGGGSTSSTPQPTSQRTVVQTTTTTANAPGGNASVPGNAMPQDQNPRQSTIQANQTNADLLKLQQDTEKKYITALNELQMLKVQLEIALANQAIAASKLSTVTSEKNISDILTKPAVTVPQGAYASNLVSPLISGQTIPGASVRSPGAVATTTTTTTNTEPGYVVLSVSEQGGRWHAVIGNAGKLFGVTIGDILQSDGSLVASISKEGVILEKDGKKKKLSINTSI